ncbi:MAG: hypothetical protein R6U02_06060 [Alkalibacterium sp.]|uniref:hypothetical protein n=1 Tax=Alkalibacterium sp. TaxID=1872447 RepID=UPI003970C2AF
MKLAKITLTSGATYMVNHSPKEVYQRITHSDGEPNNHIHLFVLENGQKMYINATYILSIEKVSSHMTNFHHDRRDGESLSEQVEESQRVNENLGATKEFKEDLNGNME